MSVPMKTCAHTGCNYQFPEHYFDDYCIIHSTPESHAAAEKRCAEIMDDPVKRAEHALKLLEAVIN